MSGPSQPSPIETARGFFYNVAVRTNGNTHPDHPHRGNIQADAGYFWKQDENFYAEWLGHLLTAEKNPNEKIFIYPMMSRPDRYTWWLDGIFDYSIFNHFQANNAFRDRMRVGISLLFDSLAPIQDNVNSIDLLLDLARLTDADVIFTVLDRKMADPAFVDLRLDSGESLGIRYFRHLVQRMPFVDEALDCYYRLRHANVGHMPDRPDRHLFVLGALAQARPDNLADHFKFLAPEMEVWRQDAHARSNLAGSVDELCRHLCFDIGFKILENREGPDAYRTNEGNAKRIALGEEFLKTYARRNELPAWVNEGLTPFLYPEYFPERPARQIHATVRHRQNRQ